MSDFLEEALLNSIGEQQVEEAVIEETVVEEVIEETPVEEVVAVETPIVEETVVVEEPVVPTKKVIDYSTFLAENEGTIKKYLDEKNTDYSKLPQEELVRRKIQEDNPEFDQYDIEDVLAEKYGIGLEKKEINEDTMTSDEIAEAKRDNAEIDKLIAKGKRELKKDASQASKHFEEIKNSLQLPTWEIEEPIVAQEPTQTFDPVAYQQELVEAEQKDKEERWIPQLKSIIDPLESLKEQIEFDDNGNKVVLDVDYKVSKEEKEEILNQLADYKAHPSDSQYLDDKGNADVERFLRDKATQLMYKKLIKTACKESYALGRKEFVKNDLLNFDDGIRNRSHASEDDGDIAVAIWNANKK